MTNSYGPPFDFKQVSTEDGEVIQTFSLEDGIIPDRAERRSSVINQSTGFIDSNREAVFFGDCVTDGSGLIYEVWLDSGIVTAFAQNFKPGMPSFNLDDYIARCVIIGNTYTPQAELERRAKEVQHSE